MSLLLLGGTADGRKLAESLHRQSLELIYSVAGLVRTPDVGCEVVSGGFTQFGGLVNYIRQQGVVAILDVTHPYAQVMSSKAVSAAKKCGIPCWRFHRESWQVQEGDDWRLYDDWKSLLPDLREKKSVFLTAGQLSQEVVDVFANNTSQCQLLRTAVKTKTQLPASMEWIKAIGPFSYDDEFALMEERGVDALVSKDSGGDATVEKLNAARALGLPVYMLARPSLPNADKIFTSRLECEKFVLEQFNISNKNHSEL